jgi:hypothetical protein
MSTENETSSILTSIPEITRGGPEPSVESPDQIASRLDAAKSCATRSMEPALPLGDSNLPISNDVGKQLADKLDEAPPAGGISDRKLAANRENARHSTGPKTPEGKAASAANSYKHGIFSAGLIRPGGEVGDQAQFEYIANSIIDYYQPVGFVEQLLVEKITVEIVRFRRLLYFETGELGRKTPFWGDAVDRVLRYQATINRQLFQALEQLDRLQTKRGSGTSSGIQSILSGTAEKPGVGEPRPGHEDENQ